MDVDRELFKECFDPYDPYEFDLYPPCHEDMMSED